MDYHTNIREIIDTVSTVVGTLVGVAGLISGWKANSIKQTVENDACTEQSQVVVCSGKYAPKKQITTLLLCIFLGIFGAHRFFVGRIRSALSFMCVGISAFMVIFLVANAESINFVLRLFFALCIALLIDLLAKVIIDIVKICRGKFADKNGYPLCKGKNAIGTAQPILLPTKERAMRNMLIEAGAVAGLFVVILATNLTTRLTPVTDFFFIINQTSIDALIETGEAYYNKREHTKALKIFNKAIKLYPNNARGYAWRGNVYRRLGQCNAAIEDFDKSISLNQNYAFPYVGLAEIAQKRGLYDVALGDYEEAIKIDPKYQAAYTGRGLVYWLKEQPDCALENFDKAIDLDQYSAFAYGNRGDFYRWKGQYDDALCDYNKAIWLDPNYSFIFNGRGNVAREKGLYDLALRDFDEAIRLDSKNTEAYISRGEVYRLQNRYNDALADLSEAIKLDSNSELAYIIRGYVYEARGQYKKAVNDYTKAIWLNPNNARNYINRGRVRLELGQTEAIQDFEKASELNPDDEDM